ncbi:hypothetical protein [Polaromonas sp. JS666]|uniref:hypothetical protein n=1 Tax=Polaromonas sp. (strain JS666 / ATCC BAA-500) TaxID=296591 RepID=UPI00059BD7D0|nr:hypothetical protein [Polaromonas sp. JS666]
MRQHLYDMVNIANCRVNLATCEATLAAMQATTTNSEVSEVIEKHNDACAEAYWMLKAAEHQADSVIESGTEEEWEALSEEDRTSNWEEFHSHCAQGIGDELYFYRVLMDKFLIGYVGH